MHKIAFGCFIVLLTAGCRKTSIGNTANNNATDIFPDKVGDTWQYLVNDTSISVISSQNKTVTHYNLTVSIIDSVYLPASIHGIPLPFGKAAKVWVYNYPGFPDTNFVYQSADTVIFFDVNQSSKSFARQYIIPFQLHNAWPYTVAGLGEVTVEGQVNVVVGQNKFDNAFFIDGGAGYPDEEFNVSEWIENNVGIVKRYVQTGGISGVNHDTKWSLVSYQLK